MLVDAVECNTLGGLAFVFALPPEARASLKARASSERSFNDFGYDAGVVLQLVIEVEVVTVLVVIPCNSQFGRYFNRK